jgi:hypothetical protein
MMRGVHDMKVSGKKVIPRVVNPGGLFNRDGGGQSEAVRSGNWLRTNWLVQAEADS